MQTVKYEYVLDKILEVGLNENQKSLFLEKVRELSKITPETIFLLAEALKKGEKRIFDGYKYIPLDNILLEHKDYIDYMDLVLPKIVKYIPLPILEYFSEKQAVSLINQINELEISDDLDKKLNEVFLSGDLSIPVQGLRGEPISYNVVVNGVLSPLLNKKLKKENGSKIKHALYDYEFLDTGSDFIKIYYKFRSKLKGYTKWI